MIVIHFIFVFILIFNFHSFAADVENYDSNSSSCYNEQVGKHILAEFYDCIVPEKSSLLEKILRKAAQKAGSNPLEFTCHKFDGQGITGVLILAESHIAVHSWPEICYAAVDVFTCGDKADPDKVIEHLKQEFRAGKVYVKEFKRGGSGDIRDDSKDIKRDDQSDDKIFGMELVLDLYDCDPKVISSEEELRRYSVELCDLIEMKRYGELFLERFGTGCDFIAGYSLAQMIETSLLSGRFSELWNRAYINIFSCKEFDAELVEEFSKKFFKAKVSKSNVRIR